MLAHLKNYLIAAGAGALAVLYLYATRGRRERVRRELQDHYTKEGYSAIEASRLANSISDDALRSELRQRGWLREGDD